MRLLEFDVVRERLAGYATFPPARELALALTPAYEISEVGRRQQGTSEALRLRELGFVADLSEARDLRGALQRAALGGVLTGEELRDLRDTLKATRGARAEVLRHRDTPVLGAFARDLPVLRDLEAELGAAIGRSGEMLDGASPILGQLRAEAHDSYQHLMDSLERTVRRLQRHDILQEPIITQRNERMVLLVKTEMKHRLPGIVHDLSDSGASTFVEPMALVGLGNRWREVRLAQEREEERIIRELSAKVEVHAADLLGGLERLAELDLAMAKARYAVAIGATAPTVLEGERQYLWLMHARHPLLEGEVVPVTAKVGDDWPVLLITGPNAGGKTVALKTVGLLALMAQAGLHLPAREANLSLFDGVYADIGDQQSIQRSLSTFSSHIQNLQAIMSQSSAGSLVLIDELGTSTDPEEGAALAKAILLYFCRWGTTLLATTHHRDVAGFAQEQPGMMNASVELDPETLAPTYRLTTGLPGRSYALTIASRLGLEDDIVGPARSLLSPAHRDSEELLRELQEERYLAEERRKEAEEALAQAEAKTAELEEQLKSLEDAKGEMIEEARHQFQQRADGLAKRLLEAERALKRAAPWPEPPLGTPVIKDARKEVAQVRRELRSPDWQPPPTRRTDWLSQLRPGQRVYLKGIPRPVEVIAPPDDSGTLEVLLGTMRARLPVYQVEKPALSHTTPSRDGIFYSRTVKRRADSELDLRGVRVEEALDRVDGYLNDATVAGLSSVRISHGVGTGALRGAIREYLARHPLVKSAGPDESITSDGVTIVELT